MGGKLKSAWAWLLLALFGAVAAPAQPGVQHIHPRLIAESGAPAPGETVTLALVMTPDKGWHGYWENPGDAGVPLSIRWALPADASVGAFRYPVPQTLLIAGLMNHVYEQEYALLAPLTVPKDAAPGAKLHIAGEAEWLACTDSVCVPERGPVALDLTVGNGAIEAATRAQFDSWRAKLPRPLGGQARFAVADGRMRIAVPLPASVAVNDPHFFASTQNALDYGAPQQISRNGDALIIETRATGSPKMLDGVLTLRNGTGLAVSGVPGMVPPAGDPVGEAATSTSLMTVLTAFAGAILGASSSTSCPASFRSSV